VRREGGGTLPKEEAKGSRREGGTGIPAKGANIQLPFRKEKVFQKRVRDHPSSVIGGEGKEEKRHSFSFSDTKKEKSVGGERPAWILS